MSTIWIEDGEKYALIALSVNVREAIPLEELKPSLLVISEGDFRFPQEWREWLGTIHSEEVEGSNLFLFSKMKSLHPNVVDAESQELQRRVWNFYIGLLLASNFAPAHKPVILSGSRVDGEIKIRQQKTLDCPVPRIFKPYPNVEIADIRRAALLGSNLLTWILHPPPNGSWRLFRTLAVYIAARTTGDVLDRLHQFCRCIDGLILPDIGQTKRQFKSKTELFIGPHHHNLMGEIYDVRSAVEHLHENRYLETFDRELRLSLLQKEAIVAHIARTALGHIVAVEALWHHFANTDSLERFWKLPKAERQQIWGSVTNPMDALIDFDPRYIHDGQLRNV